MIDEIDVIELKTRRDQADAHVLLDVRDADELAVASLTGAVHIPMTQVAARIDELPADLPIIVMCHHGGRSDRVAKFLRATGRPNAINLRGGIDAWSCEIDKTIRRY